MSGLTFAEIDRALRRAYAEDAFSWFTRIEERDGRIVAEYQSARGFYDVTIWPSGYACSCPAHGICKHPIALAELCGRMDWFVPSWYERELAA